MKILLIAVSFLVYCCITVLPNETFYLKLTELEAESMIVGGIGYLFGGVPTHFTNYTNPVIDTSSGDMYWMVNDLQYDGVKYEIIGWLDANYPSLTRYDYEFVKQFIIQTD